MNRFLDPFVRRFLRRTGAVGARPARPRPSAASSGSRHGVVAADCAGRRFRRRRSHGASEWSRCRMTERSSRHAQTATARPAACLLRTAALHCAAPHCAAPHCAALHCAALHCPAASTVARTPSTHGRSVALTAALSSLTHSMPPSPARSTGSARARPSAHTPIRHACPPVPP